MMMPGRKYSAANSYRFGFNGKENDNEVKGAEGSQQDYGMRVYDPRLGRFLSVDPLIKKYAFYAPYQFAGNNPIPNIDLDGCEPKDSKGAKEGDHRFADGHIWTFNNEDWARENNKDMDAVVIYSKNYHTPVAATVSKIYDNDNDDNTAQAARDLTNLLVNGSPLAKRIMAKLPPVPGCPNFLEIVKQISDHYAPKLYDASEAIVKNRDQPFDMVASGIGFVQPYVAVAYDLILKKIFINNAISEVNLGVFQELDLTWRNTSAFNNIVSQQPMLRNGEYIGAITVTMEQFYEIMNNKYFIPSDYKFYQIYQFNIEEISNRFFNGQKPAFNIYFNKIANKGFLHISEVGIAPINTKIF